MSDNMSSVLLDAAGVNDETRRIVSRLRHDLNNPLTSIVGLTELILLKEKTLTEEGRQRLTLILKNCARISEQLRRTGEAEDAPSDRDSSSPPAGTAAGGASKE